MRFSKIHTVLFSLLLASCAREAGSPDGYGLLELGMRREAPDIIVKDAFAAPDDMAFSIRLESEDGKHVYSLEDYRTSVSEPIEIAAGKYTISAEGGTSESSGWGISRWKGRVSTVVKPVQNNRADIICSLDGNFASVEFEEAVLNAASELSLSIDNGSAGPLVFSLAENNLDATGYLAHTGTLNYTFSILNKDGKTYNSGVRTIEAVNGKHYRIKVSVKDDEPDYILSISVDGNSVDAPDISVLTGSASNIPVVFKASRGAASVFIRHSDPQLKSLGLPEWVDFVSTADLTPVTAKGISCAKVNRGETSDISIEISSFLNSLPVGLFSLTFGITDVFGSTFSTDCKINIIPLVESRIVSSRPWAAFAYARAEWFTLERPAGLRFQYKAEGDGEWIDVDSGLHYDNAAKTVSADICGLQPGKTYVVRSVTDADIAGGKDFPELSFSTDSRMPTVPYMNFDNWYKDGDAWMPNPSGAAKVWDTANPGTASLGTTPTTPEESDVVSGKAVRMESAVAGLAGINKFAAGNIYLGQFGGLEGMGAKLNWGYPFNGRPVALRGYYKYIPKPIDYAEAPYTGLKGTPDWGSIRIFLCDWSSQFIINTSKKIFLQEDDPSVIAVSSLYFNETNSSYQHFTLPVHYNDNRIPTYIEIACAASRYGDYFTGGKGSVLLIDEFELVYDPADLSDEEREAIGYRQL